MKLDLNLFEKLVAELEEATNDLAKRVELSTRLYALTGEHLGSDASRWRSWAAEKVKGSSPGRPSRSGVTGPMRDEPEYKQLAALALVNAMSWQLDRPVDADRDVKTKWILENYLKKEIRFLLPNDTRSYRDPKKLRSISLVSEWQVDLSVAGKTVEAKWGEQHKSIETDFQLELAETMDAWARQLEDGRELYFVSCKDGYEGWLVNEAQRKHLAGACHLELQKLDDVRAAIAKSCEKKRKSASRSSADTKASLKIGLDQLLTERGFPASKEPSGNEYRGKFAKSYIALERRGWLWWLDAEKEDFETDGTYAKYLSKAFEDASMWVDRIEDRWVEELGRHLVIQVRGEEHHWLARDRRRTHRIVVDLLVDPIENLTRDHATPMATRSFSSLIWDQCQEVIGLFPRALEQEINEQKLLPKGDPRSSEVEKIDSGEIAALLREAHLRFGSIALDYPGIWYRRQHGLSELVANALRPGCGISVEYLVKALQNNDAVVVEWSRTMTEKLYETSLATADEARRLLSTK